jgi:hypothetical protein
LKCSSSLLYLVWQCLCSHGAWGSTMSVLVSRVALHLFQLGQQHRVPGVPSVIAISLVSVHRHLQVPAIMKEAHCETRPMPTPRWPGSACSQNVQLVMLVHVSVPRMSLVCAARTSGTWCLRLRPACACVCLPGACAWCLCLVLSHAVSLPSSSVMPVPALPLKRRTKTHKDTDNSLVTVWLWSG